MTIAAGKVCIGYSDPFVAKYNCVDGQVTFTEGMRLARGVSVSITPDVSDDNNFYADNEVAESENGTFSGGTAKLTVDGLHLAAERFIYGLPEPEDVSYGGDKTAKMTKHGNKAEAPYVAVGVVVHYKSGSTYTCVPIILTKTKFKTHGTEAATQEGSINWQTQDLETTLHRDDSEDNNWKWVGDDLASRAEAVAVIKGLFGVAEPAAAATTGTTEPAAAATAGTTEG